MEEVVGSIPTRSTIFFSLVHCHRLRLDCQLPGTRLHSARMSPVTHFLSGWALANATPFDHRDRALVTWACVIPDIDGFGAVPQWLTRNSAHPLNWFSDYYH